MRRESIHLGHPGYSFPFRVKLRAQSIGSGCPYIMFTELLRGWDLSVDLSSSQKHCFNASSLLEIWIEDESTGNVIFGFAKFLQPLGTSHALLRIVEIDSHNRDLLHDLLLHVTPHILEIAAA